jgi:hypothetical protein
MQHASWRRVGLFTVSILLLSALVAGRADEKKRAIGAKDGDNIDAGNVGIPPLDGAAILFNGKNLDNWTTRDGKPVKWKMEGDYFEVVAGTGDIMTKEKFGPDFQFHAEFWLPKLPPEVKGQARANSGMFLQGRYEIQVLDSYMNDTYQNGSVGALYGIIAPDKEAQKKAIKPPENWNAYDITFHAPRLGDDGKTVAKKGTLTVKLNGVTIIDNAEFDRITPAEVDKNIAAPGPILLQDHHNKSGGPNVRFRNLWLKAL